MTVRAGILDIEIMRSGDLGGWPVVLLHGFPYDGHSFDRVAELLVDAGADVVVPSLRGYGGTRLVEVADMRSGQQAALAHDLAELIDVLGLKNPVVAGYDWGGRAACVVAALRPERCAGLVSLNSYNIQNIAMAMTPDTPKNEHSLWYQYYFHNERGRAGLAADRRGICGLLWRLWSPTWPFDDATFERSAAAFDNPDFVDVVIQSYRHRFGLVAGDPALLDIERRLAAQPAITVPSITFDGTSDGVRPPAPAAQHAHHFTGPRSHRIVPDVGHNMPQEVPQVFAEAVFELVQQGFAA